MTDTSIQYIQAGVTIVLGVLGICLPKKLNPFQFKHYGSGALLRKKVPESIQIKIPKIIGGMLIFTGIVVAILTYILGPMPWE